MFCAETTSDADNCLKRSQRSKQANKEQSFIDPSVKSDFIFRVMIHNKIYAVTVSRGADLETPPRVSGSSRRSEKIKTQTAGFLDFVNHRFSACNQSLIGRFLFGYCCYLLHPRIKKVTPN